MARSWKCRRCGVSNPRIMGRCQTAGCMQKRPKPRKPAHMKALDEPYEVWVERFGERCGVCGREPTNRRLDRDHCHATGRPRGLLCHRDNRLLQSWVTPELLRAAADYLERAEEREAA